MGSFTRALSEIRRERDCFTLVTFSFFSFLQELLEEDGGCSRIKRSLSEWADSITVNAKCEGGAEGWCLSNLCPADDFVTNEFI